MNDLCRILVTQNINSTRFNDPQVKLENSSLTSSHLVPLVPDLVPKMCDSFIQISQVTLMPSDKTLLQLVEFKIKHYNILYKPYCVQYQIQNTPHYLIFGTNSAKCQDSDAKITNFWIHILPHFKMQYFSTFQNLVLLSTKFHRHSSLCDP